MRHEPEGPGELERALKKLALSDEYPFHMPGHKRDSGIVSGAFSVQIPRLEELYPLDITEIDGFDDLHATSHDDEGAGILGRIEKRAAALFGADEAFISVNGSTAGVLSAVSAAIPGGGVLIAGRMSHRSLYHAAYLNRLRLYYLNEQISPEAGISGLITPQDVEGMFNAISAGGFPEADGVFITSPTYGGICLDIRGIAERVHERGIPLITDQAHGAHFGLDERLPESAISQGADIVITSLHKTLPAMTQTALVLVKGDLADRERLRRFLRIYQSSSPSYLLMASIDDCITRMEKNASDWTGRLLDIRRMIEDGTSDLRNLIVPEWSAGMDPCKLIIRAGENTGVSGRAMFDYLVREYRLQPEMAGTDHVILILTGSDRTEAGKRLVTALKEMDARIALGELSGYDNAEALGGIFKATGVKVKVAAEDLIPDGTLSAWDAESEEVLLSEAAGRISTEMISVYPPGAPIVVPGEVMTDDITDSIVSALAHGLNVQGLRG